MGERKNAWGFGDLGNQLSLYLPNSLLPYFPISLFATVNFAHPSGIIPFLKSNKRLSLKSKVKSGASALAKLYPKGQRLPSGLLRIKNPPRLALEWGNAHQESQKSFRAKISSFLNRCCIYAHVHLRSLLAIGRSFF